MSDFVLDERLQADTVSIGALPLCEIRMMNDQQFPWLVLVPAINGVTEVYNLSEAQQRQLWQECTQIGQRLMAGFAGGKLNIATLGNVVAQLHVHVIVRFESDVAWPAPVWGKQPVVKFSNDELQQRVAKIKAMLQLS